MSSHLKKEGFSKVCPKNKLRKHFKKQSYEENIQKTYENFIYADSKRTERKSLLKIVDLCYNNLSNQAELAEVLHLPFLPGPITLHQFPTFLLEQNQVINHKDRCEEEEQTQLEFLFNFLKNVREYFYCWIIYFNEDLQVLNVKLLKKDEIELNETMFNPTINLIGIFINRTKETPYKISKEVKEEYYSESKQEQKTEIHNKSLSTINNSTGTTWKMMMNMEQVSESDEKERLKEKRKVSNMKNRSISPKFRLGSENKVGKGLSLNKNNDDCSRLIKKQEKSYSIKYLKEKSKSQLLLNRSKSNNIREIILQPIKKETIPLNMKMKPNQKSKLKKQSKVHKIESIYFKKTQKNHLFQ